MKLQYITSILALFLAISINAQDIQTIYFDFDVYTLSSKNKSTLKTFIQKIDNQSLTISGFTDPIGTEEYNNQLADKRIEQVKVFLLENGVSSQQISQASTPKNNGSNTDPYHLQRKVVIEIIPSELPIENEVIALEPKVEKATPKQTSIENIDNLEVGESLVVENLEFIPGRHFPQPYSEPELVKLLKILQQHPKLQIEIQGHICCVTDRKDGYDSDTRTWDLSVNRAKFVYEYLVNKGIDSSRLSYTGLGATQKLFPEINEQNRQANRRVEIVVVEK
jgi:outer membrane protein OmpA-like peptidoglycan-associated protein